MNNTLSISERYLNTGIYDWEFIPQGILYIETMCLSSDNMIMSLNYTKISQKKKL